MRAICEGCKTTFSRTCKPPNDNARAGTKAFGQGRPFGKAWLWVKMACDLPAEHAADSHPERNWDPGFNERRDARVEASALPNSGFWLAEERAVSPEKDGDAGEPYKLP